MGFPLVHTVEEHDVVVMLVEVGDGRFSVAGQVDRDGVGVCCHGCSSVSAAGGSGV